MERVAWMVPFARRVRTIRICSLDARGLGPIQATLFESASYTAAALLGTRRVSARQGWAGEKSGLFQHPARRTPIVRDIRTLCNSGVPLIFPHIAIHVAC